MYVALASQIVQTVSNMGFKATNVDILNTYCTMCIDVRNLKWSKFGTVKLTEDPFFLNINLIIDVVIIVYSVSIFT